LHEWFENIANKFYEEQAIKKRTSFDNIKQRYYENFHDILLCTIPSLLHKFLLEKGVVHIMDYRTPLFEPINIDWKHIKQRWEQFLEDDCKDIEEAWELFLNK
jgi:hypothetical protein